MAKVRKKYDKTAREGAKFCAAAIFFVAAGSVPGVAFACGGLLVALLVGPVMGLLVAFACGACLWDGLWAGALTLPVASLFWWRKASVWMRKPWVEGCFLKIFVEF